MRFWVLGFQSFATYTNFKVLGFQSLAITKILGSWVSRVSLHITILRSWVSRILRHTYHNFDVLGFQSPTTKRKCKVQDPSRSQTLDSANPGSRIFLGPWHMSDHSSKSRFFMFGLFIWWPERWPWNTLWSQGTGNDTYKCQRHYQCLFVGFVSANIELWLADVTKPEKSKILTLTWPDLWRHWWPRDH